DLAHQRALVADLARAVARAGAIGHAAVERHPDQTDVHPLRIFPVRGAHEGRKAGIARPGHRIFEFGQEGHGTAPRWYDIRLLLARAPRRVYASALAPDDLSPQSE